MAIIDNNLFLLGATGMVGKQMVFRKCKGQIVVAKKSVRKVPLSELQQKQTSRFKDAVAYAKDAIADEEIRRLYAERAAKSERLLTAFNVAISDYLHAPVIRHLDLSNYSGMLGDRIGIVVAEDFSVVGVMVEIFRDDGSLLEVGMAERSVFNGGNWVYYAQSEVASTAGYKVNVRVTDLPGNMTEKTEDILKKGKR